jgi:folate-dependent phosphoribosylglycinamide formyltransferase PurN
VSARVAVLASGGGTNLQAMLDHFAALGAQAPGQVALVASDRAASAALERGRAAGSDVVHIQAAAPETALADLLAQHRIDYIALAG